MNELTSLHELTNGRPTCVFPSQLPLACKLRSDSTPYCINSNWINRTLRTSTQYNSKPMYLSILVWRWRSILSTRPRIKWRLSTSQCLLIIRGIVTFPIQRSTFQVHLMGMFFVFWITYEYAILCWTKHQTPVLTPNHLLSLSRVTTSLAMRVWLQWQATTTAYMLWSNDQQRDLCTQHRRRRWLRQRAEWQLDRKMVAVWLYI